MSAVLNPNYFSRSVERNKYTLCSCGKRTPKDTLRMKDGCEVCPECAKKS